MKRLGLLLGALLFSSPLYAVDAVSLEYGKGANESAELVRVGLEWDWKRQWFDEGDWLVTGFWEASAASWRGTNNQTTNQTITDLGFTPVFRLQQKQPSGFAPYLEGAIGFHLISPTSINANRKFGSAFQFGDHVGVGARFGEHQQFDLGWRFQHVSNGDIKQPNHGINFNQVRFAWHF